MLFDLDPIPYTYQAFINNIISFELDSNKNFKVSCFLTEFSDWDEGTPSLREIFEKNGFRIQDFGEIKLGLFENSILNFDKEIELAFYFYLDNRTKTLLAFTDLNSEYVKKIFVNIVNYESNIYTLFVGTSSFNNLIKNIKTKWDDSKCVFFIAKHKKTFVTKGEKRPNKDRTISYWATDGDGFDALNELKRSYGVLPTLMHYNVPDIGTIEVQNIGLFRVASETNKEESRLLLLRIIEIVVEDILRKKKILVESKYTLIPVETKYRTLNLPSIKPWQINLQDRIEDSTLDSIVELFNKEHFPIYNSVKYYGNSFNFSGMVADGKKNSLFSISLDNNSLLISPIENCKFDSFMRFYNVIVENIDPEADILEVDISD